MKGKWKGRRGEERRGEERENMHNIREQRKENKKKLRRRTN